MPRISKSAVTTFALQILMNMSKRNRSNHELAESLGKRVESQLKMAIATFQNLPEHILTRPSTTGGWSIAQCLWHLNSYGHHYLPHLTQSLQNANDCKPDQLFKPGWLGNYFSNLMEPGPKMKTIKADKAHTPPAISEPYPVIAEFIQQQETLLSLIEQARRKDLNKRTVPVSILPWLKLKPGDVLSFIVAHNERHLQQAIRNL